MEHSSIIAKTNCLEKGPKIRDNSYNNPNTFVLTVTNNMVYFFTITFS